MTTTLTIEQKERLFTKPQPFYTLIEASTCLRISKTYAYQLVQKGKLRTKKRPYGGRILITYKEMQRHGFEPVPNPTNEEQ